MTSSRKELCREESLVMRVPRGEAATPAPPSLSVCVTVVRVSRWFLPGSPLTSPLSALSMLFSPQHERPQCCAAVRGAFLQCHQVRGDSPHGGAEARAPRSQDSYTSYSEYCGLLSSVLLLWVVENWQVLRDRGFSLWKTGKEMQKQGLAHWECPSPMANWPWPLLFPRQSGEGEQ